MKKILLSLMFGPAFFGAIAVSGAFAQGVILPIPCDSRPCRPRPIPQPLPNVLPVKSIKLDTKIEGQVATTHVEQVFRNDTRFTVEGTYFFPIPDGASVVEFAIWEDGKRLVGEVRSREEARRIYDEIVRRQRDPGLLEYAGKDLLQASIFPIPPNSDKKVELRYTQILKAESGTVAYRYPLGTGRNLWRGRPGAEAGVRNMPPQSFGTVSGKIEIVGREPLRNIYSPSHAIEVNRRDDRRAVVSFESSDNDKDVQLFYGLSEGDFSMSLLTYREPGKDGYFLLTLSPRDDLGEREIAAKDIVFVLDTSGSMADAGKMEKARAALLFGIRTLRDSDRFNVIGFAGEERLMESGLIRADSAGKKKGEEFVGRLQPTGGTNINDALIASLKQFESGNRPKMLVFMTDGLPTVGETNAAKILSNFKAARKIDVRVFPFGFGYDVNTALLDKLGTENAGISDYVQPQEDLEVKVSNFFARVSSPVLSDVEIDLGPIQAEMVYPRKPGDLFKGMQTTLIGRYRNENDLRDVVVTLSGKTGNAPKAYEFRGLDFPRRATDNDFLPRLWATRRVGWLVEEIRANGETKEVKDEIVELGTRFGIVTPYTSYLATDGSFVSARRAAGSGLIAPPTARPRALEMSSGRDAVAQSVQQNTQKANVSLAERSDMRAEDQVTVKRSAENQFVANRNFFLENEVWVDADIRPETKLPETKVQFGSEEYYRLIGREPMLAQYFAIGEQVSVIWNGRVYRVVK